MAFIDSTSAQRVELLRQSEKTSNLTRRVTIGSGNLGTPEGAEGDALCNALVDALAAIGYGDGGSEVPEPEYYYVLPIAGQSNAMAYGEGIPLPDGVDKPDPRIKQMARRATWYPTGPACKYNDVIPLDHCPHDVQDMSGYTLPQAVLPGQYGCVSQALHIAKKVLGNLPPEAGILVVPCARGGAAFTAGAVGAYNPATGATEVSARWGVGQPLYLDFIARIKAALDKNPKNQLLAVVWMQGEFDAMQNQTLWSQQPAMFNTMLTQWRTDMADYAARCPKGAVANVPWVVGDTTYDWKNKYPAAYEAIWGNYKNREAEKMYFVEFAQYPWGGNVPTNLPAEDPNIPDKDYYGAAARTSANWTASGRATHFSSWARRGIISDLLSAAINTYSQRTPADLYLFDRS